MQTTVKTLAPKSARKHSVWHFLSPFIIGLIAALILIPGLGVGKSVIDPSEGFYAEGAREMVESGDYLTPHLNYQLWLEKPPLTYCVIAASFNLLGINTFASRLPSAIFALSLIVLLYVIIRKHLGNRAAIFSSLVLAASPMFMVIGRLALTDMPLTFCLSAALLCFLDNILGKRNFGIYIAYALLGLGCLTKGPVAVFIAATVIGLFLLLTSRSKEDFFQSFWKLQPILGLIIMAAVAVPWFIIDNQITHGQLYQEFFVKQNLGRLKGVVDHQNPFWFYIPYFSGGFTPWVLFLPVSIISLFKIAQKKRTSLTKQNKVVIFAALWATFVFIFFSAIPTKLATYITPMFPALALLAGLTLNSLSRIKKANIFDKQIVPLIIVMIIGAVVAAILVKYNLAMQIKLVTFISIMAIGYLIALKQAHNLKTKSAINALLASSLLGCATIIPNAIESFYETHQAGLFGLVNQAEKISPNWKMVRYAPSVSFLVKRKIDVIRDDAALQSFMQEPGPHNIVTSKETIASLTSWLGHSPQPINRAGKWFLLSLD